MLTREAYLYSDDDELTNTEFHDTDGEWVLHICLQTEIEPYPSDKTPEHRTVIGIDPGVWNIADYFAATDIGVR